MIEGRAEEEATTDEGAKGTHCIGKEGGHKPAGDGLQEEVPFVVDIYNSDDPNVKWYMGFGNEDRADTHSHTGQPVEEDNQAVHRNMEGDNQGVHRNLGVGIGYSHRVGYRGMKMEGGNCVGYPYAQQIITELAILFLNRRRSQFLSNKTQSETQSAHSSKGLLSINSRTVKIPGISNYS